MTPRSYAPRYSHKLGLLSCSAACTFLLALAPVAGAESLDGLVNADPGSGTVTVLPDSTGTSGVLTVNLGGANVGGGALPALPVSTSSLLPTPTLPTPTNLPVVSNLLNAAGGATATPPASGTGSGSGSGSSSTGSGSSGTVPITASLGDSGVIEGLSDQLGVKAAVCTSLAVVTLGASCPSSSSSSTTPTNGGSGQSAGSGTGSSTGGASGTATKSAKAKTGTGATLGASANPAAASLDATDASSSSGGKGNLPFTGQNLIPALLLALAGMFGGSALYRLRPPAIRRAASRATLVPRRVSSR